MFSTSSEEEKSELWLQDGLASQLRASLAAKNGDKPEKGAQGKGKTKENGAVLDARLKKHSLERATSVREALRRRSESFLQGGNSQSSGDNSGDSAGGPVGALETGEVVLECVDALASCADRAKASCDTVLELREEMGGDSAGEEEMIADALVEAAEAIDALAAAEVGLLQAIARDEVALDQTDGSDNGNGSGGGNVVSLDSRSAIVEVRPAAGGDEAGLFALELLEMIEGFAETSGWQFERLILEMNSMGGLKYVVCVCLFAVCSLFVCL
jgi:PCRF domain